MSDQHQEPVSAAPAAIDPYAEVAEWYDLEHDGLSDDLECYSELLRPAGGARASVLEVGAGSGRIAAALATAGYEVTGLEPSPAMRQRALARLHTLPPRVAGRIHVVAGQAEDYGFSPDLRFHAVLFGLNTFAHLSSVLQRREALENAYAHLRPDGRLLLDLDLAGTRRLLHSAGQLFVQGTWKYGGDGNRWVSHLISGAPGPESGTLQITHFYDVSSSTGELRRTIAQMVLAVLSAGELQLSVTMAGFEILAVYGDFDLEPYDDLSARAIVLARRPTDE